jgi:hypothetical protein
LFRVGRLLFIADVMTIFGPRDILLMCACIVLNSIHAKPVCSLCSYVILYAHISAAIPKWFPTRSHRHRGEKIKQKAKKVNGQFLSNSSHILSFPIRFFITINLNAREKNKLSCSWSNRKFWVFLFQTTYRGAVCSPSSIWHPQSVTDQIEWKFRRGSPLVPGMFLPLYTEKGLYIYIFWSKLISTYYTKQQGRIIHHDVWFEYHFYTSCVCVTSTVKERGEHFFASCLVHNIINPWRWWRYSRSRFKKSCAPLRAQFSFPYQQWRKSDRTLKKVERGKE